MQKENLMETVVPVVAPAPVELAASGLAAAPDRSVIDAVIAVRGKIATRPHPHGRKGSPQRVDSG